MSTEADTITINDSLANRVHDFAKRTGRDPQEVVATAVREKVNTIDDTEQHHRVETIGMERRHWILLGQLAREYNVTEGQLASVMVEEEMEQIRQHGADNGALLCWLRNVKPVQDGSTLDAEKANEILVALEEAADGLTDYTGQRSNDVDRTVCALASSIFNLVHRLRAEAIPEQ